MCVFTNKIITIVEVITIIKLIIIIIINLFERAFKNTKY